MAFQKPMVNTIKPDIKNLSIYLRSTRKFGKSTLFRDVILEKYGDPTYGLSVSCGHEKGEKLLDQLNVTRINSYKEAVELKDWLIKEKGKEHNIEIISFDTVDELYPLFEKECVRISNIENPTKKVKTINAAMGGRHNGQIYTANDLMKPYMTELQDAGFGVWAISHTKFKTIKEKGSTDEDGWQQLTSTLMSTYDTVFGDIFDVVLTGVIDKDIEERKSTDSTGKEVVKRYATGEVRKLYFRGTSLIDAGGRFAFGAVPEYMIFDKDDMSSDFIKVVEEGMEKSKKELGKKNKSISKPVPQPVIEEESDDILDEQPKHEPEEFYTTESDYPEDLLQEVTSMYKESKDASMKKKIREIVKEYGKGLSDCDEETLKEVYDMLKQ